jgi:uncharacterized protein YbaP (TraB family)
LTPPEIGSDGIVAATRAKFEATALGIANSTGRLWQITSSDGAVSHLWGTIHSNDPLVLNLPDQLRAVLSRANFVALEADPILRSRADLEFYAQGSSFYRDTSLPNPYGSIDRRVLDWIELRMISVGYGEDAIHTLTALGMASIVLQDPCNDFASGILPIQDYRILLLGLDAGAEVVGLEPLDAIIQSLNDDDRQETAFAIIEAYGSLLNPGDKKFSRRTFFALYLQGRIGEMLAYEQQYLEGFFGPDKARRILDLLNGYLVHERNLGFVEAALSLLTAGRSVIAVGVAHLPGELGLINLFRRAGFRVERVMTSGEVPGAN